MPGKSDPVTITTDDLLTFTELRLYDLVRDLINVGMTHKSVCDAFDHYSERRLYLTQITEVMNVQGSVAASDPRSFSSETRVVMMEIDTLAQSILGRLPRAVNEADQLLSQMNASMRRHFGRRMPSFVPDIDSNETTGTN